ncbi:MAG: multidrug effflux MFS transporter [Desulfobacter sp.]|nr:MAG: multidrug effflux MFS transporter [Desulfobacter sp.]
MKTGPGYREFITLMAVIISITALAIDVMLPALPDIGRDLGVGHANDVQLVISVLILGLGVGQLFWGPLSDRFGRKPIILIGFIIFVAGCLLSIFASRFDTMLAGRFVQGVGAAGPRTAIVALIRDQYDGRAMARIMSAIMAIFIFVPAIAPALGQVVMLTAGWRTIFFVLMLQGMVAATWFCLRQPETLPAGHRVLFSARRILRGLVEVCTTRISLGYTLAAGFMSGALLSYLNCAQPIFQDIYKLGRLFPLYMACIALSLGGASFLNSRIVMRFGMRVLSYRAVFFFTLLMAAYLGLSLYMDGQPPLGVMVGFFALSFFCLGILFGNLNAVAMDPLGHIAGIGASVIGSLTSLISSPLSAFIGGYYDGTTIPLALGFVTLGGLTYLAMRWGDGFADKKEQ